MIFSDAAFAAAAGSTGRVAMNEQTEKALAAAAVLGIQYDEAAQAVFQHKEIVAPILQMVVPEFKDCTVREIIGYFETDISVADPVDDIDSDVLDPRTVNPRITGMGTEMKSVTEKLITYDTHFRIRNPKLSDGHIAVMLHINMEIQNDYRPKSPSYPIVKRGIYYAARELCAQLGRLTGTTDYGDLEKVYSIWIINSSIPENEKNTVSEYHMVKHDRIGSVEEQEELYDLLSVILIRRGNARTEAGIYEYLNGIFHADKQLIEKYSDVVWSSKVTGEVKRMSGLGEAIMRQAMEQGLEKGKELGLEQGMQRGRELEIIISVKEGDYSPERGAQKLGCSLEDFRKKMELAGG